MTWISRRSGPFLFAALVGALCACAIPAAAQDSPPRLSAIGADVVLVRVTGGWSDGQRSGLTRVIILRVPGREEAYRLFVQWMAVEARTGRVTVVATEEVREVFEWRVKVEDYRVEPDAEGARMVIEATVLTNAMPRGYILTIGAPNETTFGTR